MGLTWQVFISSCSILVMALLFTAPLLFVGYLVLRAHARLKRHLLGLHLATGELDESQAKQTEAPERKETKEAEAAPFSKSWTLDDRDREESWDRERRRRYGRHQHKHGPHHRRGGSARTTPAA